MASSSAPKWSIEPSLAANRTSNPIRAIVDQMKIAPNPDKEVIKLSIGDPTVFGNLPPSPVMEEAVTDALRSGRFNGYPHSCGYAESRDAVAKYCSRENAVLTAEDVIIASGCSGALELAIPALANEGDNILIPNPGFSLYKTICDSHGIVPRPYTLLADRDWEADLSHMESLIDDRTRAVLINNPSNPCGSVYTSDHLKAIIALCERHQLPIISDEIYAEMTFGGVDFVPIASLSKNVPVLAVGGLAKRFMVPGWRVGWVLVHDRDGKLEGIRGALLALSTLVLGANSIAQAALPRVLADTPQEYYDKTMATLRENAEFCYERLGRIRGLKPIRPQGAMYIMTYVDVSILHDIRDDRDFSEKLFSEESVFVLPGQCFGMASFFRIVFCPPLPQLEIALDRIRSFCERHSNAA